uniref:Tetratricopeptide repeat protein n=1 Tax=Desertifilum tharense IPPAS B-1220 TaxID=1781255 RepID=A0ACD5GU11_9CYAN
MKMAFSTQSLTQWFNEPGVLRMQSSTLAILALATLLAPDGEQAAVAGTLPANVVPSAIATPQSSEVPYTVIADSQPEMLLAQAQPQLNLTQSDVRELRQLILAVANDATTATDANVQRSQSLDYSITLLNALLVILTFFPFATILLFLVVRKLVVQELVEDVKKQLHKVGELENYLDNYNEKADGYLEQLNQEIGKHKQKIKDELQDIVNRSELSKASIQQIEALKSQFMMHLQFMVSEAQSEKDKIFQELYKIKPSLTLDSPTGNGTRQVKLEKTDSPFTKADSNDFIKQAERLMKEGRHAEAIAIYQKATQQHPEVYEAWFGLGHSLSEKEQYEDAINAYDRANKLNPNRFECWYNRGNTLGKLQRYQEALENYDKALEIQPERLEIWYNRGSILRRLERYEEALAAYDKALSLSPKQPQIWYNRAQVLVSLQQLEEAIASYDRAIEITPQKAEFWVQRGIACERLKRDSEALESFDRALQVNPKEEEALRHRMNLLEKRNSMKTRLLFAIAFSV